MFSQLRHAVENLAPQAHRPSDNGTADESRRETARSQSLDSQASRPTTVLSSSQLAESALSNLRKSLGAQRSSSPSPATRSPPERERQHKSNLEERLRATFAIGEASNATTPDVSARATPSPAQIMPRNPVSPTSTPLPESRPTSPSNEPEPQPVLHVTPPVIQPPQSSFPINAERDINSSLPDAGHGAALPVTEIQAPEPRHPEADISLPLTPTEDAKPTDKDTIEATSLGPAQKSDNNSSDLDVDALQQQLRLLEQRFTDVSASFRKLQAEKFAADGVIQELTPLGGLGDADGLRRYLEGLALKAEISQDEIKRLNGKLTRQEERVEELRDTHRLESASQSDQIERLRKQLSEADAFVKASQISLSRKNDESDERKADIDRLQAEVERWKASVKEEEEKRVKAISLLKTVRQKLVKAEKDKEDAVKDLTTLKDRELAEREKDKAEKLKLRNEIETVNAEREKAVASVRVQFDRELANVKERSDKEVTALREQFELELLTMKNAHSKELAARDAQISSLENSVNSLSKDKSDFFEQLQIRQAELESSQSQLEVLQSQNTELEYQLRECNGRLSAMHDDFVESRREQDSKSREPATSAEDVARMLSGVESKYETKIADMKANLSTIEKERNESEAEWSRKLREKAKETEALKRVVDASAKATEKNQELVTELRAEVERLHAESATYRKEIHVLQMKTDQVRDVETSVQATTLEYTTKINTLERQLEEMKAREAQSRANNKTLREELRKVQSSAALLERQRNPGVGYWTSKGEGNPVDARPSISSTSSDTASRAGSPRPGSPALAKSDEELNLEYLRNVILQFLEHKEMRPNLVRVLSIILHFTPQETRRLVAKV